MVDDQKDESESKPSADDMQTKKEVTHKDVAYERLRGLRTALLEHEAVNYRQIVELIDIMTNDELVPVVVAPAPPPDAV